MQHAHNHGSYRSVFLATARPIQWMQVKGLPVQLLPHYLPLFHACVPCKQRCSGQDLYFLPPGKRLQAPGLHLTVSASFAQQCDVAAGVRCQGQETVLATLNQSYIHPAFPHCFEVLLAAGFTPFFPWFGVTGARLPCVGGCFSSGPLLYPRKASKCTSKTA